MVPVPIFDVEGNWVNVEMVQQYEFPRADDHPSRILVGRSTGETIYPSALPKSVHLNDKVRWFYQLHVFLHEFFHTIELPRRSREAREKVILSRYGRQFTMQQWWEKWEKEFSSDQKPPYATRYASTYGNDLSPDVLEKNHDRFTRALAEQICESFVGYILGIVPNDQDNPRFRTHSAFAWELMDEFADASIVSC
jgi:hypothetical protein